MGHSETRFIFWDGVPNVAGDKIDAGVHCKFDGLLLAQDLKGPSATSPVPQLTVGGSSPTPAVLPGPRIRIKGVDERFKPVEELLSIALRLRPVVPTKSLLLRIYGDDRLVYQEIFKGAELQRLPDKDPRAEDQTEKGKTKFPLKNKWHEVSLKKPGGDKVPGSRRYTVRVWIAGDGAFDGVTAATPADQVPGDSNQTYRKRPVNENDATAVQAENERIEKQRQKYADRPGGNQTVALPLRQEITFPDKLRARTPVVIAFANGVLELDDIACASDVAPRLKTALGWKGCAELQAGDVAKIENAVSEQIAAAKDPDDPLVIDCASITVNGTDGKPSIALLHELKGHAALHVKGKQTGISPPSGWVRKWSPPAWNKAGCAPWEALLDRLGAPADKSAADKLAAAQANAFGYGCKRALGEFDVYRKVLFPEGIAKYRDPAQRKSLKGSTDHPLVDVPALGWETPVRVENDLPGYPATNGGVNFLVERWPGSAGEGKGFRLIAEVRLNDERNHYDDSVTLSIGYRWTNPGGTPSDGEQTVAMEIATVRPLAYRARVVRNISFAELAAALKKTGLDIESFKAGDEVYLNASFNNTKRGTAYHYHGRKDRGGRFLVPVDGFDKHKPVFFDETISDIRDINLSATIPESMHKEWLLKGGSVITSMETEAEFFLFSAGPGQTDRRAAAIQALEEVVKRMAALVGDKDQIAKVFGDGDFTVSVLEAEDGDVRPSLSSLAQAKKLGKPKIFLDHYLDFAPAAGAADTAYPLLKNGAILRLRDRPRAKEKVDLLAVKGAAKAGTDPAQVRYCAQIELNKIAAPAARVPNAKGKEKDWADRNEKEIGSFVQVRSWMAQFNTPLRPVLVSVQGLRKKDTLASAKENSERLAPVSHACAERLKVRSIRYRYKIEHKSDPIDIDFSADFATGWLPDQAASLTEEEAKKFPKEGKFDAKAEDAAAMVLAFELGLGHLGAAVNPAASAGVGGAVQQATAAPVASGGSSKKKLVGGTVLHTMRSFDALRPTDMGGHARFAQIVQTLRGYLTQGLEFTAEPGGNKAQTMARLFRLWT